MIRYEWDVETLDEFGDILDHDHRDTYADALKAAVQMTDKYNIVLVRDQINNEDFDLEDRSWAYMENGQLPEHFTDAGGYDSLRVPAKFHAEIKRANRMMGVSNVS